MSEFLAGCLLGLLAAAVMVFLYRRRAARSSSSPPETRRMAEREEPSPNDDPAASSARQWISAANHDLRQPLQAIKLLTTVLVHTEDPVKRREVADNLGEALAIMARMLDGLVDLSKLEGGEIMAAPSAMAAGGLLARLKTAYVARAEAANIELRIVGSSVAIRSDPRWLERIVAIFLENALVHGRATKVLLGCRRRGAHLSIEVHDNGRGLGEDDLERIFQPFHRQSAAESGGGLGVGLAIAERASRLLGHSLEASSHVGRGSRFAVVAPRAERQKPVPEATGVATPNPSSTA